jgi:hypothetical protein
MLMASICNLIVPTLLVATPLAGAYANVITDWDEKAVSIVRLRHIAVADRQMHQVSKAIDWTRKNFDRPLCIDVLAQTAHMSAS